MLWERKSLQPRRSEFQTTSSKKIRLLALFVFALGLHLCGTWILPLMDRDEPRFAEAAREMRERGDWILPTFNNAPRYDKPPLTYWCQRLFYKIFGENDVAARLHSALSAALTALVIFGFCSRLYGERAAWRAALAFTLCLQVMLLAKASVADMPMALFITLATWAGWELLTHRSEKWRWIFYLALALGFLAKGPVAWLPIGAVLIFAKWKRIDGVNGALKFHYGIPLMLLLIGIWGVPALLETHGEFFNAGIGKHVLHRSFSPLEGHGANSAPAYFAMLPFYFLTVFASFFPWSVFFGKTFFRLKKQRTDADVYLLCGIGLTFAIFTLVKTKLPHYTLPAFPLLACLAAPQLAAMRPSLFTQLAAGMTALNLALAFIACPLLNGHVLLPVKQISASVKLPPNAEFASTGYDEPGQVWYFRRQLKTWHILLQPDEVVNFMNKPGPRLCILPSERIGSISLNPDWEQKTFHGKNLADHGKNLSLTMLLKR